jgi:hypothetical protein
MLVDRARPEFPGDALRLLENALLISSDYLAGILPTT